MVALLSQKGKCEDCPKGFKSASKPLITPLLPKLGKIVLLSRNGGVRQRRQRWESLVLLGDGDEVWKSLGFALPAVSDSEAPLSINLTEFFVCWAIALMSARAADPVDATSLADNSDNHVCKHVLRRQNSLERECL